MSQARLDFAPMLFPLALPAAWLGPWAEMQRAQWQALILLQESLLVLQKDLWEQWACRYAGGVPIDS